MLLSNGTELAYRVRVHPRARHVRIVLSRRHGLVITIPRGFDRSRIPEILKQKRAWIERVLSRLPMKLEPYRLPERIALSAIGEEWTVEYVKGNPKQVELVQRSDRTLFVSGAIDRPDAVNCLAERFDQNRMVFLSGDYKEEQFHALALTPNPMGLTSLQIQG